MTFTDLETVYAKWLQLGHDPYILRIIFASIIANRYDGNPLWLMIVGPSGSGKTALLTGLEKTEECYLTASLTPTSLASGSTGWSVLHEINNKVLVVKDFSTISSMNKDAKEQLLSFLREAYDGTFIRHVGSRKEPIRWEGRFGFLGCTTSMAAESDILNSQVLGERFITIRMKLTEAHLDLMMAQKYDCSMNKTLMEKEISEAGQQFFQNFQYGAFNIDPALRDTIINLAKAIAWLRSPVVRNREDREIDMPISETRETPTRLIGQLKSMSTGLMAMFTPIDEIKKILMRIAGDAIPVKRSRCLKILCRSQKLGKKTSQIRIADLMGVSPQSAMRVIDDMVLLGVINKQTLHVKLPILLEVFG